AHVPLRRARSLGRAPHFGPRRGHVPGQDRRDHRPQVALRFAPAPVHEGAALGGADPRPGARGTARARRARRRGAEPAEPAVGLRVSSPLPDRDRPLQGRGARPSRDQTGAPRGVPARLTRGRPVFDAETARARSWLSSETLWRTTNATLPI